MQEGSGSIRGEVGRGAGGDGVGSPIQPENPQVGRKNFLRENDVRLVPGAPDISHPADGEKYERQIAFIYDWFFEMRDRIASDDDKAAHGARAELQTLWLNALGVLLKLALDKTNSSAKQWAGMMLASIFVSINKHDSEKGKARRKLSKTNETYRQEKSRLGKLRTDVLLATKVTELVWRELKVTINYRNRLRRFKAIKCWKTEAKRQGIPEAYWPCVNLRDFSEKSESHWWKFLWPLIKKKIDTSSLPRLAQHDPETGGVKPRKRYPSDLQHTAGRVANIRSLEGQAPFVLGLPWRTPEVPYCSSAQDWLPCAHEHRFRIRAGC